MSGRVGCGEFLEFDFFGEIRCCLVGGKLGDR